MIGLSFETVYAASLRQLQRHVHFHEHRRAFDFDVYLVDFINVAATWRCNKSTLKSAEVNE